jgi:mannose-6-phosphate isomerase-like protein (cupin superfamily)
MVTMERRDFFGFAAGLAGMAGLLEAAGAKLPDAVIPSDKAKITQEPFGELRVYFDGPTDQLKSMTAGSLRLNPGQEPHPPHRHPEEEIMVVTEGSGEIAIAGKTTRVGPGAMMYSAANKTHGIRNTGKVPLMFYYYKWTK